MSRASSQAGARRDEPPEPASLEPARLSRADRRDAILEAAVELVATGDVDAVSMETVAERAGVSRPLVYKHFANRGDLLAALYEREASLLHAELAADVESAGTLEEMFRALIHGALRAQASRGATLAALRSVGLRSRASRERQRERDRRTVRYFGRRAARQLDLDETRARAGVATMLGALETVLARWRRRPTSEHAAMLEETYVAMVVGGLDELAKRADTGAT